MIERFGIYFEPGAEERVISVWLPVGYESCDMRYPVMYMFDGQNAFEAERAAYGKSFNLHTFMAQWEKEMIIVGVQSSAESDRRLAEYCPYQQTQRRWAGLRAHGHETMCWIVNALKPEIDARYRTLPERACTGLLGASTGALAALYAVIAFNEVFSKAACISPAICTCSDLLIGQMARDGIDADTRVYLSLGEEEAKDKRALARMTGDILSLGQAFMCRGARVYLALQQHGRHCEADWRQQIPTCMRFLWLEE